MNVDQISVLFPSFVMQATVDEFSDAENRELADLAWENQRRNYSRKDSQEKRVNMFEANKDNPLIQRFASVMDSAVRLYVKQVYRYECTESIDMMCDSFCQSKQTNTHGMWTHTHPLRPIVLSYYPVFEYTERGSTSTSSGIDGQINFYDPAGFGKRVVDNKNSSFFADTIYRVPVKARKLLVFEGYMPHDSAPFEGEERVAIAIFAYPRMAGRNEGIPLELMK